VAVDWFPEHEAPLATGLISMSLVLGILISNGILPNIFNDPDDIPYMNISLFVIVAVALVSAVVLVHADRPPTPPTNSADVEIHTHMSYGAK